MLIVADVCSVGVSVCSDRKKKIEGTLVNTVSNSEKLKRARWRTDVVGWCRSKTLVMVRASSYSPQPVGRSQSPAGSIEDRGRSRVTAPPLQFISPEVAQLAF